MKKYVKTLALAVIALGGVNVAYSGDCMQPATALDGDSYSVVYTAFGDARYCADSGTVTGDLVLAYPGPDGLGAYDEDYRWPAQQTGDQHSLSISQADSP